LLLLRARKVKAFPVCEVLSTRNQESVYGVLPPNQRTLLCPVSAPSWSVLSTEGGGRLLPQRRRPQKPHPPPLLRLHGMPQPAFRWAPKLRVLRSSAPRNLWRNYAR